MFYCQNEEELVAFGQSLGQLLKKQDILVLTGELGTGKTTLTKGIARGLDIVQMIKSPTYTIVREYEGRLPLYHLDIYRIGNDPDSVDLDHFLFGDGVVVIEWGNFLDPAYLGDFLEITLSPSGEGRRLDFKTNGKRSKTLYEEVLDLWQK